MYSAQYHRTVKLVTYLSCTAVAWHGLLHTDWRVATGGHEHILTGVQKRYWELVDHAIGVPPYTPAERALIADKITDDDRITLEQRYAMCSDEREAARLALRRVVGEGDATKL